MDYYMRINFGGKIQLHWDSLKNIKTRVCMF